ncbi:MFS transporter, partial [Parabacteroides sp. OttesenSCG-928-G06]|nr:MFS transporter [Parabacteroides sp. OttesenSCG-928-G06]
GAFLLARYSSARFLRYTTLVAILSFILLLAINHSWFMFAMIAVVGLMCANIFSILFSFALQRRPERANEISALMIMGVSGGALVTPVMGIVSDHLGQVPGLSVLLICMLYISIISFVRK